MMVGNGTRPRGSIWYSSTGDHVLVELEALLGSDSEEAHLTHDSAYYGDTETGQEVPRYRQL